MASSVNSRASSLEIPLAWSHVSSSQPVPPASPSGSQPQLPSTPPQQRFPQPGARRLSAGQPLNIKPQQAGLQSFTDSLQILKKKLETEKKVHSDFMAYARETGSEFWELPAPSHLPSDMEIAAFDATLKALSARLNEDQTIDVRYSPSSPSDIFPYSSSFPVPFTLTSSGQGMGTARFSISGELGLLVFQSVATKSIAFDKEAISAYQPPSGHVNNPGESPVHANPTDPAPMEEATRRHIIAQGKRKAFASSAEALRESRSRENTGSPASYILQDAKLAAALQAEELEKDVEPAEESSLSKPEPVSADTVTGSSTLPVPVTYSAIHSHSFVNDAWELLPKGDKTARSLYAVLLDAKKKVKDGEALSDAMKHYLEAFKSKNDAEKHKAISQIISDNPKLSSLFSQINVAIDSRKSSSSIKASLTNFAAFMNEAPQSKANKKIRRTPDEGARFAFRSIAKLAFPEPPFQAAVKALFNNSADKRKLEDAFLIDEAMARIGIPPNEIVDATDHVAALVRMQALRHSLTVNSSKSLLLEYRKKRYPHELDEVLEAAIDELELENRRYHDNCAQALPFIAAKNNQSNIAVLNRLKDKDEIFAGLAQFFGITTDKVPRLYKSVASNLSKTAAIVNYLAGKSTTGKVSHPPAHSPALAEDDSVGGADPVHAGSTSMKRQELSGASSPQSSPPASPNDGETTAPANTRQASLNRAPPKKKQRTLR